ncbi:MAG: hypothetical protein IKJ87_08125 [Ruminococcus sp.]|nr:hypothetical protein [Ruminococcus sp.]
MLNLIKADLYRITKTKGFYLYWAIVLVTYIVNIAYKSYGGISLGAPLEYDESLQIDIGAVAMNFTFYFLNIFPVFSIICGEYSEHTIKNSISSTISKKNFFISKYIFTMGYTLFSYVFANYAYYFANRLINGEDYSSTFGEFSGAFFRQFPLMAAIVSLFIGLAFLLRKGAAFNSVTIITPIVYTSAALALYGISSTKKIAEKLLTYETSTMLSRLALDYSSNYTVKCFIISALIIILSLFIGYFSFTKRELE